jgi:hypothetical protein
MRLLRLRSLHRASATGTHPRARKKLIPQYIEEHSSQLLPGEDGMISAQDARDHPEESMQFLKALEKVPLVDVEAEANKASRAEAKAAKKASRPAGGRRLHKEPPPRTTA